MKSILPILAPYISSVNKVLSGIARYARGNPDWHLSLTCESRSGLPPKWCGDGIITQDTGKSARLFMAKHYGTPTVMVSPDVPDPEAKIGVVTENNKAICKIAVRYFISCGHRNFCWYGGHRTRQQAFEMELKALGVERVHAIPLAPRHDSVEWIRKHMKKLTLPCAIFCGNDALARELLDVALLSGYEIPGQVAVLGIDNEPMLCESSFIPLSSIDNRLEAVGYEAASLLDRMMHGETAPSEPILIEPVPYPVVRGSTDSLASSNPTVNAAIRLMRERHRDRIRITDVAKAVCISESGLRKLLERVAGASPKELLTDMRIETACRLLREGFCNTSEIAAKSGFGDYQRMHAAFKFKLHATPAEYRETRKGL